MAKFTRRNLSSGYGSTTQLNFNFEEIEDHLNNRVLYRNNPDGEPNQMENELDMNSHAIHNLGSPDKLQDAARLKDITDNARNLSTTTAVSTSLSDDNNYFDSENVEGALKEIGKEGMMWVDREDATFQSSSALSLSDDKVNASRPWTIGDRVKVEGTSTGTVYGTIDAIDYNTTVSGSTYVSISLDSGSLSNEALTLWVGAVSAQNPSIGSAGMKDTGTEPDEVPTNADLGGAAYEDTVTEGGPVVVAPPGPLLYTVGAAGDFTTINDAIAFLAKHVGQYVPNQVAAEIKLLSGFTMAEQVLIDGHDFCWMMITAEDAEVTIQRSALTVDAQGTGGADSRPAFYVTHGGGLPQIGALFNMDASGAGTGTVGVHVSMGARGKVHNQCGVKNAGFRGFYNSGGKAHINNTIWSGAGQIGCRTSDGGQTTGRSLDCTNCGGQGIGGEAGIAVMGGSICNHNNCDVSGSVLDGAIVGNGSHARLAGLTAVGSGQYGLMVEEGSVVEAGSSQITGSGADNVRVQDGSVVNVRDSTLTGATSRALYVVRGAMANATASNLSGAGASGVIAQDGGVACVRNADCRISGGAGTDPNDIRVLGGGIISAQGADGDASISLNTLDADGIIWK